METLKAQIYPLIITFVSGFLSTLGASLAIANNPDWTSSAIFALIISAVSGGLNAVFAKKVPTSLGGKKG